MRTPSPYRRSLYLLSALFCTILCAPQRARCATYCDSTNPQVHVSGKLVWCADPTFWAAHAADVTPFFTFADALLPTLAKDFGVDAPGPFYIVVNQPNGGASTPTPYGPGINITGDAFYNSAYGIKGFYGYLLVTHEFVNQWTGLMGGSGWPTDWWANHRSPFPNAMDPFIMAQLGQSKAATAQTARFAPGGDSADPEVVMFTNLMKDFGGFAFVQRLTAMLQADAMQWWRLMDPPNYNKSTMFVSGNPSPLLSNYVAAYLGLSAGEDVTARLTASGVGTAPPNWPATGTPFIPYSLSSTKVAAIANAHCALNAARAQGVDVTSALAAFQRGNFGAVNFGGGRATCQAGCPTECGCSSTGACVAKWTSSGATPAAPTPSSTGVTLMQQPSFSLDIPQGKTANGTQVQIAQRNNGSSQAWVYDSNQLVAMGKCLAAQGKTNQAAATLQDCNLGALQQWTRSGAALQLAGTNLCLDVPNNAIVAGTKLWLYTCNGSNAQKWNVPVPQARLSIRAAATPGMCMDVRGGLSDAGTPVQLWSCNATTAQRWSVAGGRVRALSKCLGATKLASGSTLQVLACDQTLNQVWTEQNGGLMLKGTQLCLDIPNNNAVPGQNLRLWACNGTAAQTLNLE